MITKTKYESVETQVWSEGEWFTVYGLTAVFGDGRRFRCDDISCRAEDVERLIALLEQKDTPYEELFGEIERFVDSD